MELSTVEDIYSKAWRPQYVLKLFLGPAITFFDSVGYHMFQQAAKPSQVYQSVVDPYMALFHGLVFKVIFVATGMQYYHVSFRSAAALKRPQTFGS